MYVEKGSRSKSYMISIDQSKGDEGSIFGSNGLAYQCDETRDQTQHT